MLENSSRDVSALSRQQYVCLDRATSLTTRTGWPESTAHHTTNPSLPLFGILSIALCLIGIAVLGTAVLRRRATAGLGAQETQTAGSA